MRVLTFVVRFFAISELNVTVTVFGGESGEMAGMLRCTSVLRLADVCPSVCVVLWATCVCDCDAGQPLLVESPDRTEQIPRMLDDTANTVWVKYKSGTCVEGTESLC